MTHLLDSPRLGAFRGIVANAGSLVGTTAVTALLGFAFWWVAARLFAPEEVGFTAASIAAMQLLGAIGMFGCGTLLIGEIQQRRAQATALIATTLTATGLLGLALGVGFALVAPRVADDLRPLAASPLNLGLFALGVGLTTATLVLDQAVLGLQQGGLQLRRNTIFAGVKLAVLVPAAFVLARDYALGIYATWVIGLVVSLAWLGGRALALGLRPRDCLPRWGLLRGLGRAALEHHALNLALQAPSLALPMVVTATLSTAQNAYFYTAWMLAGFVFVPPVALAISLFAAAGSPVDLARKLRFTLGAATLIGLAANVVLVPGADPILRFFGADYAAHASWPLRIIGFGVFGLIVKDHYVALCRIQRRVSGAILLIAGGSFAELALATLGALRGGLTGLALGWLLAITLQALIMAPPIYRAARPIESPSVDRADERGLVAL